jgi:hypothetical protein
MDKAKFDYKLPEDWAREAEGVAVPTESEG